MKLIGLTKNSLLVYYDPDDSSQNLNANLVDKCVNTFRVRSRHIIDRIKLIDPNHENILGIMKKIINQEELMYNVVNIPYVINISDSEKKYFFTNRFYKKIGSYDKDWEIYPFNPERQVHLYIDGWHNEGFIHYQNKLKCMLLLLNNYENVGSKIPEEVNAILAMN